MHREEARFGIYVHVPFCRHKCLYCDFYSLVPGAYPKGYAGYVMREYGMAGHLVGGRLGSIYLGGGTPSVLHLRDVEAILGALLGGRLAREVEVTMECNPEDLSPGYLQGLRGVGINRLSIGVQSLDAAVLRLLGRRHDAEDAARAVEWAVAAGFDSLSVDVIYGIPHQSEAILRGTLERLVALGPQHVSAYHLTRELGTQYDYWCRQRRLREVEEVTSERHFALTRELLTGAGYEQYEISNFAQPNHRARHNAGYWDGIPYLGLGPGAHSYDGQRRWHSPRNYRAYCRSIEAGELPYAYEPPSSPGELLTEWLLMRLRTAEGLDLQDLADRFGDEARDGTLQGAQRWMAEGVAVVEAGWLRMHPDHFLLTDSVLLDLMPDA